MKSNDRMESSNINILKIIIVLITKYYLANKDYNYATASKEVSLHL